MLLGGIDLGGIGPALVADRTTGGQAGTTGGIDLGGVARQAGTTGGVDFFAQGFEGGTVWETAFAFARAFAFVCGGISFEGGKSVPSISRLNLISTVPSIWASG